MIDKDKRLIKLKDKLNKANAEKLGFENENKELEKQKSEHYKRVQDMTVDYTTTKKAIGKMKEINITISSNEDKIERRENNIQYALEDIDRLEK